MQKIYTRIANKKIAAHDGLFGEWGRRKKVLLSPVYWSLAHFLNVPGLNFQRYIAELGFRILLQGKMQKRFRNSLLFYPMDSVRYFEFDFVWKSMQINKNLGNYLDVSSPRFFPAVVLDKYRKSAVTMINPDGRDLQTTKDLMDMCGFTNRCIFIQCMIDGFACQDEKFDTITCISVIEHIPGNGDLLAVQKMWQMLAKGGRLYLTVPCASEALEEHTDINEYGLLQPDANGFVFYQRFYDETMLEEKIFRMTGKPVHSEFFGEKTAGHFISNRGGKVTDPSYPHWQEPYIVGKNYSYFNSVSALPGWGVAAFEFQKN